jgi:hypothetical protein
MINLSAQTDYRNGYIITHSQDTIRGLIDLRSETLNMKKCSFKKNEKDAVTEYTANDILGYQIENGKYFISKHVQTKEFNDTVFVEFLLKGIYNLYFYKNTNYAAYYIENNEGQLIELRSVEKIVEQNSRKYMITDKRYIGLLNIALADCPELKNKIAQTDFTHKSLIQITKKYHSYKCTDEACIVYEKKLPVLKVEIAPLFGTALSKIAIGTKLKDKQFDPVFSSFWGIAFDFKIPHINDKISLYSEITYSKEHHTGTLKRNFYELTVKTTQFDIKTSSLSTGVAVKYTYPKGWFRPVMYGGLIGKHFFNSNYERSDMQLSDSFSKDFIIFGLGFQGGAGAEFILSNRLKSFLSCSYKYTFHHDKLRSINIHTSALAFTTGLIF